MKFQCQKMSKSTRHKQQGFLSIEVIIVLVVVLGLLALGASKMDMLNTGGETIEELSNIQTLYSNAKSLKYSQGYGDNGVDLTSQLIAVKGVPKNMSVINGKIKNLFDGDVEIKSTGAGFSISTSKLRPEVCIKLATKLSRSGSFASTSVNGNSDISGEVTPAIAVTQCNDTDNKNTLKFTTTS